MAQLYRQKLLTFEALEYTGSNHEEMMAFCPSLKYVGGKLLMTVGPEDVEITTGSWIQKGPAGNFAPCTSDFLLFYEPV